MSNQIGAVESLLFVSGDTGLTLLELSDLLHIQTSDVTVLLETLQQKYHDDEQCGLALVSFANRYQIVTKGIYSEVIKEYAVSPFATKLSQAALETLAIIAYKQPLTRAQIDQIRGVQSTGALQKLQMRDLIESKGRENSPGKPILYGTTDYFMNYFGITDMSELPDLDQLEMIQEDTLQDLFEERYKKEYQTNDVKIEDATE
ncbi:SMC-Scp complex subunit ScpB [Granulicatella sp. zg-ZJ]|uniref:SMC-Scp complex subunit ScpB n=1 Tax=Granulicatella sp. zg-ZJ TaxID=2678504 RepID=UPI0013D3233D|nr:SMC-Scp complex subunit ScpB [Granulicatella sp. zg-ZJ]NEW63392.1 SMC-Scp complex subunit ScpB [Granulicatella sp. zg-ZJ]